MAALVPLSDAIARCGCGDEIQPVQAWVSGLAGEDLDEITVVQRCRQRTQPIVDARPVAVVPHFGVNAVSEVHGRGSLAQAHHITLGCEHEDLLIKKVLLDRCEVVVVVVTAALLLPVHQLPQPVEALSITAAARR